MDKVDEIYDIIEDAIDDYYRENTKSVEQLSIEICEKLGICEKCGAKLKGERNE